jgi:cell division protein FtsN
MNNNFLNKKKMKKYTLFCAAMCAAMVFTSCKSSESAYKQAYLKAKQQEEAQQQVPAAQETNVVTPMVERPVNNTQVVDNADNIAVRQEQVTVVSGVGLKNFSVVVGSFSLKANADGLQQTLKSEGYDAQIVMNNNVTPAMYRVVATTFDSKVDAAASRNGLQSKYPGAWLLYAK